MKYSRVFPAMFIVLLPFPAVAANVYPGCSVPSLKAGHHTFYVDPVNGSMGGDGSATKPWRTLTEVLDPANKLISTQGHAGAAYLNGSDTALHAVNPNAPIKAGDLLLLRSGNHGAPTLTNMFNTDFITVMAAPGAAPVIGKMAVVSSAKWMFQGLTFEGMASTVTGATSAKLASGLLVSIGAGDWEGQTSDMVFDNDTFQAAASTSGWNDFDWLNKPYSYAVRVNAPCSALTSSHIINAMNGIGTTYEKVLLQGNIVELFANDAVDIAASNLMVKGNTIRGGLNTLSDPLHADGIQGWSLTVNGVLATNTNVTIDGNTIIKTGDPSTTYMHGISVFDGKWNNLVIQNNVVAVDTWHAIAVWGTQNTKILNNTVVAPDLAGHPSWIQVHDGKDGTVSTGATVRNNIAAIFDIANGNTTFDHNIAASQIVTHPNGTASYANSGTVGTANSVLPAVLTGFVTLNTDAGIFDLRLRSTSVAVGFGTATGAPSVDILGKARTAPIDVGAYVH